MKASDIISQKVQEKVKAIGGGEIVRYRRMSDKFGHLQPVGVVLYEMPSLRGTYACHTFYVNGQGDLATIDLQHGCYDLKVTHGGPFDQKCKMLDNRNY